MNNNFDLRKFLSENRLTGASRRISENTSLEKNLQKRIINLLKKRNPTVDPTLIAKETEKWLDTGKNLITATNATGDDYIKDVIIPIESNL